MQSLINYQKNKYTYYNSLSAQINYNNIPFNESKLVLEHGSAIDSVLYKLNKCTSRYNNLYFEGHDDVLFTLEEQIASRDILLLTCKIYLEDLCNEYSIDVPINEDMGDTIQNLKGFIKKIGDYAKEKGEQFKDNLQSVTEKLKSIKEFIQQVSSKAIKSAKELAEKFMDLMIVVKDKLSNIFEKLGGNIKEIQKEFETHILDVIKNKSSRPKESIYEQLQNHLKDGKEINEELLVEFKLFGKKKDKEESEESEKSNEYEDSIQKGEGEKEKSSKLKKGRSIILGILKQIAISTTILVIIPAIIGCAWGPAAAMIAATIAKAMMTGYGFYRLCKNIYQTIKTGKFKEASKWGKFGYIILWTFSFGLLAWGAKKAAADFKQIWDAFSEGNLKTLVPDEMVQSAMGLLNKIWKTISGQDTPGWEELQKVNAGITEWEKIEETKGKTNDNFEAKELKGLGDTNDFKNIENNLGKEVSDKLKEATEASIKSSKGVQDAFTNAIDGSKLPSDTHVVLVDGNTAAKMIRSGLMDGTDGAKVAVNQITNTALQASSHGQAGTMFMVVVKGSKDAAEGIISQAAKSAGEHGVDLVSKIISGSATETVTKMIPHTVSAISGGFAPIIALPGILKKKVNKGFLLRLGSSRSGNNIYAIKEDGIKGMTFKDVKSKFGDLNKPVIDNMTSIINKNYKTLENAKTELEKKTNLDDKDKKLLKGITQQLEKMKDGIDEYECLVFYSDQVVEAQNKEENTNESFLGKLFGKGEDPKIKDIEYKPVMFINPICMTCGDLTDSSKKRGPRKKPIYLKGLFASYEFLPGKEGMNEEDIDDMLKSIMTESIKTAWNMSADAPCIKKSKKEYIENDESLFKGKERDDFGKFTNTEITEIFNNPSSITKYMSGSYSKRSTVEKENTEKQKERKAKAKEEWKDNIENNEEVKKIIDESPSLKKNLIDDEGKVKPEALDELSDAFLRMETSYNKGKNKKSLWQKIKSFFTGDDEKSEKYDSKEVQNLAYKLASLHKDKLKSKRKEKENKSEVTESLIYEIELLDESIKNLEMNMKDLLSEEFLEFLETNIINESEEIQIELIKE